jgi:hypothetical protein
MFCTYLTVYFGDKLPKRYIGSSTVKRVFSGYNGSVKSKKYKTLYSEEQIENKHLFKTRILNIYETQEEAINAEKDLHIRYDVVKNESYMNESIASPKGFFGRPVIGKDHPFYNKKHSLESKLKVSKGLKKAYTEGRLKSHFASDEWSVKGEKNPFYGKTHSEETKNKMRKPKRHIPKWKCSCCDKILDGGNLVNHMINKHDWCKEDVTKYRTSTTPIS